MPDDDLEAFIKTHTYGDFQPGSDGEDIFAATPKEVRAFFAAHLQAAVRAAEERGRSDGWDAAIDKSSKEIVAARIDELTTVLHVNESASSPRWTYENVKRRLHDLKKEASK